MLEKKVILETVVFGGDQSEGYRYPEIGGYGDIVSCTITHTNRTDVENSVVVNIGSHKLLLLPEQLEHLLQQVKFYKMAAKQFPEDF